MSVSGPFATAIAGPVAGPITDPGIGGGAFDPVSLFSGSDAGVILSYTEAANLATATNGTGTMTDSGLIAYALDTGPQAKPATQAMAGSRPRWLGIPRTLGAENATNGRFTSDTGWTKGTGWTIASGKASKSAGTAALLSQAQTLVADQAYMVFYSVEATAGTVTPQFTGGTTVSGTARSATGSYSELMVSVTGNTTFAFSADAAFAGAVKLLSIKPVSAYAIRGAWFDGIDDIMQTTAVDMSASDKATIVFCGMYSEKGGSTTPFEVGNYYGSITGSVAGLYNSAPNARLRGDTASVETAVVGEGSAGGVNFMHVSTVLVDLAQTGVADEVKMRARGVLPTQTTTGTAAGGGAMANAAITIGNNASAFLPFAGLVCKFSAINRTLTAPELASYEGWAKKGMAYCAVLGDSTVAVNNAAFGLTNATSTASLVGGMVCGAADMSTAGENIAQQKARWVALPDKSALQAVIIQIGLNDVRGRIGFNTATSAQVIADLQDLVTTVIADKPAGCKVYISQMTPCKLWLDSATNPSAAYAGWQAVNEAIAGSGATPITGVDGRITSHVAALNDGSGNLLTIYDHNADGVHLSNEGRFIVAQAWRTQLEADGLV